MHAGDMAWVLPELVWHLEDLRVGMSLPEPLHRATRVEVREGLAGGHGRRRALRGISVALRARRGRDDPAEFERRHYDYWTRLVPDAEQAHFFTPAAGRRSGRRTIRGYRAAIAPAAHLDPADKALYFEAKTFLHGLLVVEDRVSMANSLEVRVPFLDNELVEIALQNSRPAQVRRRVGQAHPARGDAGPPPGSAREAQAGVQPTRRVVVPRPDDGVHPGAAARPAHDSSEGTSRRRWVERMLAQHASGRSNHRLLIWSLLSFEWWNRLFIDGEPPDPSRDMARDDAHREGHERSENALGRPWSASGPVSAALRVLHVPSAVGGHPGGLARAERELGLDSVAVSLFPHPFGHAVDEVLGRDGDSPARRYSNRARLLFRMCLVDVVHFNFGEPLLPIPHEVAGRHRAWRVDLRCATWRSSAARQADRRHIPGRRRPPGVVGGLLVKAVPERYTPELDAARRRTIAGLRPHMPTRSSSSIPTLSRCFPTEPPSSLTRVSILSSGRCTEESGGRSTAHRSRAFRSASERDRGHRCRGGATSSGRGAVASSSSCKALSARLFARLSSVRRSSLTSSTPAGTAGFAVEAMALGKPVVAALISCGYPASPLSSARSSRRRRLCRHARRSICGAAARPPTSGGVSALAGRAFVEHWHDPREVARTVIATYRR